MILMTMKLIRLHHVQLELQASTLATTLGATPAPVDTPLLSFFAFSLLCRSLRCLRAIQFAVPARFAFFPTVFAHVNRNVWRPTMLPHTPTHKHTHGGRQTMCAHYTQFYTFFLRLACTCNAALFNIKWRLIPGSTSSQSTHTHRPLCSIIAPARAVKCSSSSTGGCHWGCLYVCRLQR